MKFLSVIVFGFAIIMASVDSVPIGEEELFEQGDSETLENDAGMTDTAYSIANETGNEFQKREINQTETTSVLPERSGRFRRATCDLLSFELSFIKVNHAACAARCIAKRRGFKGGYCKGTVCHCRR